MPDKNKIILGTNDDTYIAADDAGNIVLQHEEGQRVALTNSAIEPATDETLDLGSPTNKFKDLYLSSDSIFIGNTKLSSDPTTGALSTVVADEQGQFTAPAAAIGGGGATLSDWEATGTVWRNNDYFNNPNTGNPDIDAMFANFVANVPETTNFLDPIAIWNLTKGANPVLDPNYIINGYRSDYSQSDYFSSSHRANPDTFQFYNLGYISIPNNPGPFMQPMEFSLVDPVALGPHRGTNRDWVTVFQDSEGKYFKDFIKSITDGNRIKEFRFRLECDIVYTCSDAATAAATPFFNQMQPDEDGVIRRTFSRWTFPEMIARHRKNYNTDDTAYNYNSGRVDPNDQFALENWSFASMARSNGVRDLYQNFPYIVDEMFTEGTGGQYTGEGGQHPNMTHMTTTYVKIEPTGSVNGHRWNRNKQHYTDTWHYAGQDMDSLMDFKWGYGSLCWTSDFFEGGITNHADHPGSQSTFYANAGRGCETKLRIKLL